MNWTDDQIIRLKEYREEFTLFSVMHNRAAAYCSRWSKRLSFPGVLFGTLATGFAILSDVPYAGAACALTSTVAIAVEKLYRFEERHANHTGASDAFKMLVMDIDKAILSNKKESFDLYFAALVERYKQLTKSSPIIPENVLEKYLLDVNLETQKMFGFGLDEIVIDKKDDKPKLSHSLSTLDEHEDFYESWERKKQMRKKKEYRNIARIASMRQKISHSFDVSEEEKDDQKQ